MNDVDRWIRLAGALIVAAAMSACGEPGSGDAPCPEGTVRSGATECISADGGPIGDPDDGVEADSGPDLDADPGADAGPVGALPLIVDEVFAASGFMGDGETGGITAGNDCPTRGGDGDGLCHHFVHTPGEAGWAGIWWQGPAGNWGDDPGYAVPAGATRVQFAAWGAAGGETITFATGYGPADGFNAEITVELTDTPTVYVLDVAGVPYGDVAGGFSWVNEGAGGGVDFYIDDIKFMADPEDAVDPCTSRCATVRGLADCGGIPGYGVCRDTCAAQRAGPCGADADAWLTCLGDGGWQCRADAPVAANDCAAERDALFACEGGDQPATLPFYVDDHFFMTGYMGGGEIEVVDCPGDAGEGGPCRGIVWTPNGAPWVGFFFQHPAENWGDLPGLAVAPGATHVRFRAWGATGGERTNFAVGIAEVDGFSNETGYIPLPAEPIEGWLPVPGDVAELTGGFAWFLENPGDAGSVTFYLDDVEWRDDAPPGAGGDGCTAPDAENYDPEALEDDGSCRFPITFRVDMNCAEAPFGQVFISGPFCEWCGEGFPLVDDDGDGVWEATYAFEAGLLEYKYMVDGFADQENLIDDVVAGGQCAPVTDGAEFANRQIEVDGAATIEQTYGQCDACDDDPQPPEMVDVSFSVDMRCEGPAAFDTVFVSGPFCDWCAEGFPLADGDGDGVWQGTFSFPTGPLEYKYMVDGFAAQEDLIDDVAAGSGRCAPVTDGVNFANRQVMLAGDVALDDTYGRCTACDGEPVDPGEGGAFATITFDDPAVEYVLTGFGGAEDAAVEADPTGGGNLVARVIKSDAAEPWAGTTVSTGPNQSVPRLPIDAANTRMTVRVYSPDAGIQVRVKVENAADPTITVETEATTTVANQWEVLTFDFANQAPGTAALNPAATYDKVSIFFNFGVPGADAGARTYYFDDVAFAGGQPVDPEEPVDPGEGGAFATIAFDDPAVEYVLTGFGGAEDAAVEADPTGGGNLVARVIKSDAAEPWAGTTVSTGPNQSVPRLPIDAANTRMTVRVYSPDAGIQVRVKVENAADPTITVETEATTTVANQWEVLTFDFANQAPGTAALNPAATYDKVSIFFNFGVPGADAGARTYYFDDVSAP